MPEVIIPPTNPILRPPIETPPVQVYEELRTEASSIQSALNQLQGTLGTLATPFYPPPEEAEAAQVARPEVASSDAANGQPQGTGQNSAANDKTLSTLQAQAAVAVTRAIVENTQARLILEILAAVTPAGGDATDPEPLMALTLSPVPGQAGGSIRPDDDKSNPDSGRPPDLDAGVGGGSDGGVSGGNSSGWSVSVSGSMTGSFNVSASSAGGTATVSSPGWTGSIGFSRGADGGTR